MATVTVRFFARYAELAGCEVARVTVPGGSRVTVAEVMRRVRETLPGIEALPPRPLVAINLRQAPLDAAVRDGDEVAVLPPLAGG
jgi:molybdopterin converting factor small subunit